MQCLVLPYRKEPGASNMALDEASLDSVADDPSHALIRTYGWDEATLSLGYFQKLEDARSESRFHDVPIVRRPTGGGAIWHHHELTYALVIPSDHPRVRTSRTLYHDVHAAIATWLRGHGVESHERGESTLEPIPKRPGRFCAFRTERRPTWFSGASRSSAVRRGGERAPFSSMARSCWPVQRPCRSLPAWPISADPLSNRKPGPIPSATRSPRRSASRPYPPPGRKPLWNEPANSKSDCTEIPSGTIDADRRDFQRPDHAKLLPPRRRWLIMKEVCSPLFKPDAEPIESLLAVHLAAFAPRSPNSSHLAIF